MERATEELKTIDYFFYYGLSPLDEETKHDMVVGLLQPKRSLFYDRNDGAGVGEYENYPGSLVLQVDLRYSIAMWVSRRNGEVSKGNAGYPDRRVAVSQSTISVDVGTDSKAGEVDVGVSYIPYADYAKIQSVVFPAGVGAQR